MDEDEEMWFNDDEDDEEGESVEKSRTEDDFSDSYGKYMEAKKGRIPKQPAIRLCLHWKLRHKRTGWPRRFSLNVLFV